MAKFSRREFLKQTGISLVSLLTASCTNTLKHLRNERPNILWITCEDIGPHFGCYGDTYAYTPNVDQLASEGLKFTNAFSTASVCTPSRSTIITGVYASSLGTQHLRGPVTLDESIHCFTEYLRKAGYYCSNNSKEDYNFETPGSAWVDSSDRAHWRNRKDGQPFFSVFNFVITHQSQTRYNLTKLKKITQRLDAKEHHDPDDAPVWPYYPDTPNVRANIAALYTQITLMDKKVKKILDSLKKDGLEDNTIVFFFSDHGDGLPRAKRWLHDTGTKIPLIVRFPKQYQHLAPRNHPRTVEEMVSFIDFAPTVLNLTGFKIPPYMQGKPFLGTDLQARDNYLFTIRDRVDENLELSRAMREPRYHYIRNFFPHRPRMQHNAYSEITPIRKELRSLHKKEKLEGAEKWLMASSKPAEELYDTVKDPYELKNLADNPEYRDKIKSMKSRLFRWMIETRDTSLIPEPQMHILSKNSSPYEIARNDRIYPIERILSVADLVGRGTEHLDELKGHLKDNNAIIRYWAATGLAALGNGASPASADLEKALSDESACVRFAAGEALCYIGKEKQAIEVIAKGLYDDGVRIRLYAAMTLAAVGDSARYAVKEMKKALTLKSGFNPYNKPTENAILYSLSKLE